MGSSIGGLVGGVAGSFFGAPTVGAALGSGIGGLIGGSETAGSAASANNAVGGNIYGAGQYGQRSSMFRPIGITTNFGKSNFTYNPQTGQLESAGYTLDPRLQGISDATLASAGAYNPAAIGAAAQPLMGGASTLFNLGNQYLATSPEQAKADYMSSQLAALAPSDEQQLAAIRNQQFQTGRIGLATGGTSAGNLAASNPELAAYYNSIAKRNLGLAAGAEQAAQQRTAFGAGLFGTGGGLLSQVPQLTSAGYTPLNTMLGTANTIEGMGQNAFDLSTSLGAGQSTANANAARYGVAGATAAAPYQYAGQSYNQLGSILSAGGSNASGFGEVGGKLGNWFQDMIGGGPTYAGPSYGTNPSFDNSWFNTNSYD